MSFKYDSQTTTDETPGRQRGGVEDEVEVEVERERERERDERERERKGERCVGSRSASEKHKSDLGVVETLQEGQQSRLATAGKGCQ